ncbi:MAG: hypothetical protein PHV39_06300 [Methanomicrobium sp.]|nr:hypothetical protein [Methanomicrobium sp.]
MQNKKRFSDNSESGVSEAIGFIIMFSIVLTGIAMVTLYAYPVLLQSQISSDERTMEQTMITLQNEMKILTYSNVPYRDTAIRVSGGYLDATDYSKSNDKFNMTFKNISGSDELFEFSPGELRYTSSEGTAVYTIENGAVLSREKFQTGSAMIAEPRWYYDESTQTLVILLTRIAADRDYSLGNIGDVQMSMLTEPKTIDMNYGSSTAITLVYTPDTQNDLSAAWRNYLTGDAISDVHHFDEDYSNPGTYTFSNVYRFVLKEYTIKIENL